MTIQYVIAIHLMRWLTNSYDFSFKWTATAAIGIHPTKAWLSRLINFKNAIWTWGHFRRTICKKIVLNLEKRPQTRMECFRLLLEHLAWIEHQSLYGIRDSWKAGSLWGMMRGVRGVRKLIHQSWRDSLGMYKGKALLPGYIYIYIRKQGLDYRDGGKLSWCPFCSNSLWQGWSCELVHCPNGNATDSIWRVLASSKGISSWTPLKP